MTTLEPSPTPTEAARTNLDAAPIPVSRGLRSLIGDPIAQAMARARGESQEAATEARERIEANRPVIQDIIDNPVTHEPAPQMEQIPEAPSQTPKESPARVFAQFLPIVAMLGGTLVKHNATAALRAGAAAMNAARTNDKEAVERATKEWELNVQRITANNRTKLDQYNAILADAKMTLDEKMALLQALAAAEGNDLRLAQLASGQLAEFTQGVQLEMNATVAIQEAAARSEANKIARDRLALEQQGLAIPNQVFSEWRRANPDATPEQMVEFARSVTEATSKTAAGSKGTAATRDRITITLPAAVDATRALDALEAEGYRLDQDEVAENLIRAPTRPGSQETSLDRMRDTAARRVGGDDYTQFKSAMSGWEQGIMNTLSGAQVTTQEARRMIRAALPEVGDDEATIARKARTRRQYMNGAAQIISAPPPFPDDASFDWAPYQTGGSTSPSTSAALPPPARRVNGQPYTMKDGSQATWNAQAQQFER